MLFDGLDEDPVQAKKKPRRNAPADSPPQDAPEPQPVRAMLPAVATKPLGVTEDIYECLDERCLAGMHEIIEEHRGQWLLECVFCGTKQRARAIKGFIKPNEDEFVFPAGDYAGMSIEAVWGDERGRGYIQWAVDESPHQAVRDACKKHLDSIPAAT